MTRLEISQTSLTARVASASPKPLDHQPMIAAVVCTHNRARLLDRALASLTTQSLSPEKYEVIVVDNASQDDIVEVVRRSSTSSVSIVYCSEPRLGLSQARNTGLLRATAPIVAYIDDDAQADCEWLETLAGAFDRESHRPLCVGGKVELVWEASRPAWLPDAALTPLGMMDLGTEARTCLSHERLFGVNLAFDRSFLLEAGGFDVRLGRNGLSLLTNEDIEIQIRLNARGGLVQYEPRALVRHLVTRERLRFAWFIRRTYAQGVSDALLSEILAAQEPGMRHSARLRRRVLDRLRVILEANSSQAALLCLMSAAFLLGRASRFLGSPSREESVDQAAATETTRNRFAKKFDNRGDNVE